MIKKIIIACLLLVNILHAATINTSKAQYTPNENISVTFAAMTAKNQDWVGIYPAGSSNAWGNVIAWQWTEDVTAGNLNFNALPVGNYEARAFYNNSLTSVASKAFSVTVAQGNPQVTTTKNVYAPNETVKVNFTGMIAKNKDWVGIYPAGSSNAWGNVITWQWTEDVTAGNLNFNDLPVGNYEVRAFYNNSFTTVAKKTFSITAAQDNAHITTTKDVYAPNETVKVNFTGMAAKNKDWVGIYPANKSNAWGNVIQWRWTGDTTNGNLNFDAMPVGNYEVRAFYNNSFTLVTKKAFSVEVNNAVATLTSVKDVYQVNDDVLIDFKNIKAATDTWLAIYPAGSSNAWGNVVKWKWNAGAVTEGRANFDKLPGGNYEARVFYNNSFKLEAKVAFSVEDNAPLTTLYEDAEDGFDQEWFSANPNLKPFIIAPGAADSAHSVRVRLTGGSFSFNHPPRKMKYLILDTRVGIASHNGNFGVIVQTTKGNRRIAFSSYLNHRGANGGNDFRNPIKIDPFISHDGYLHNHPGPTDFYLATKNGTFIHYKINIEEKLHMLEPDNELLSITYFTSAGGDFDNIKLSSH